MRLFLGEASELQRLIKLSKPNCIPCQIVGDQLKELNVPYVDFNIKENSNSGLIEKYKLTGVPVLILLDDNNKEVYRVTGVNPSELTKIVNLLNE